MSNNTYEITKGTFTGEASSIEHAGRWIKDLLLNSTASDVIRIEVVGAIEKYSLWKHEGSKNIYLYNGIDYVCVEVGSGARPIGHTPNKDYDLKNLRPYTP